MLKSTSSGNILEQNLSRGIHQYGIPILISPKLLRRYGYGQVDLCLYYRGEIFLYEVKTHPELISPKQVRRLKGSLHFLMKTFNSHGHFQVINSLPKQFTFFNLSI